MPDRPMVRPPRRIREDGYVKEDNIVDLPKAEEILKAVFKREFPRSRKVMVRSPDRAIDTRQATPHIQLLGG